MTLLEQLNNDLKIAMKEKDSLKLSVVRMVKGAVQLAAINSKKELTDSDVIDVVSKQIKMRKDSIAEFTKAGRDDLVTQNEQEIAILSNYLPVQLSASEVEAIIDEAFAKINPTSAKEMGLIMKEVTPSLKGKTDMGAVSSLIKEKLANL